MDPYEARNLYIYLGLDSIFSLNLNHLLFYNSKPKLEKVFPFPESDVTRSNYPGLPLFSGIFVMDSKLHCISEVKDKVFSFNLPSFSPDHSTHIPWRSIGLGFKRPGPFWFTTISNKVYALDPLSTAFQVFEPEIGEWKRLPPPPKVPRQTANQLFSVFEPETGKWNSLPESSYASLYKVSVFQNKILLQTCYGDFIFDANTDLPIQKWEEATNKLFPRILAALEYQDFVFVLTKKPYKLVVYESASFGQRNCFSRVLDIWKGWRFDFSELHIRWASFNLVGNDLICLVIISNDKIHIYLIRFMKTYIYADLEAYHECDIPRELKEASDVSLYSTFIWGTDINCYESKENRRTISQYLTKGDQIEEDNLMDHNQDRYLYIYFGGLGALLSLNFNELCKKDLESKSDLRLVFSHYNKGAEFPVGMGLFAWDSNLHFFGGENLEVHKNEMCYMDPEFLEFSNIVGLNPDVQPKYLKYWYENLLKSGNGSASKPIESREKLELDEWFNQKVFSFNLPYVTSCKTPPLPNHSGCKLRPLVFTISDKIYALSTITLSTISLETFEDCKEKLNFFEVFEPEKNEWRHIDKLPSELYNDILHNTLEIESHCVIRDKMLLQTSKGDYVFYSVLEDWDNESEMFYPDIYSALEYNDEVLLVVTRDPVELLVYELASFGKKDSTFGKLDIVNERTYFPFTYICAASLNLIDHNHISLVLITGNDIRVTVFKVEAPYRNAVVEVHKVFDAPKNCFMGIQPYSTFLLGLDVNQHDDTKAAGPREENSTVSELEICQSNEWELFKKHMTNLYR